MTLWLYTISVNVYDYFGVLSSHILFSYYSLRVISGEMKKKKWGNVICVRYILGFVFMWFPVWLNAKVFFFKFDFNKFRSTCSYPATWRLNYIIDSYYLNAVYHCRKMNRKKLESFKWTFYRRFGQKIWQIEIQQVINAGKETILNRNLAFIM